MGKRERWRERYRAIDGFSPAGRRIFVDGPRRRARPTAEENESKSADWWVMVMSRSRTGNWGDEEGRDAGGESFGVALRHICGACRELQVAGDSRRWTVRLWKRPRLGTKQRSRVMSGVGRGWAEEQINRLSEEGNIGREKQI